MRLECLCGETQRVLQLECQLANWRGAAVAVSRAAHEQLASLRAALRWQAKRLGLQFRALQPTPPYELQAKPSAIAGAQAAHLEILSGEVQRVQQLECQLVDCRCAAAAESRAAQEQLASFEGCAAEPGGAAGLADSSRRRRRDGA